MKRPLHAPPRKGRGFFMDRKSWLIAAVVLIALIVVVWTTQTGDGNPPHEPQDIGAAPATDTPVANAPPQEAAAPVDLTPVTFATDWRAQAEHGGFYQALVRGFYAARGLDVRIRQGGPGVNVPQLIAGGAVDFGLGSNAFIAMNLAAEGIPVRAVMASFQKDPQVLITHQREDVEWIADMKGKPIMVSDATIGAFWQWLKAKYDFEDSQIRRYTFNVAPFLTDENMIQQGYLTSEPYIIEQALGHPPQVFLLADDGYPGYAAMIFTHQRMIDERPEIVRAFVEASIAGWEDYLHGDPTPGNTLIMADNPEMTPDIIAQAIEKMHKWRIVETEDTDTHGIGTMNHARWRYFFETMRDEGVYPADLDFTRAYTLDFVASPDDE
jgi:NitT/TauT family transport system substrate-binding protein